jgi:hypothetical protein
MREPVFTETMQIGIVVRALDAAMRRHVDDCGIGPPRSAGHLRQRLLYNDLQGGRPDSNRRRPAWEAGRS